MTNEYELADNNRADLIYEKSDLLAPLLPGMEQPPHPMRLGRDEGDYYRGTYAGPGAGEEPRSERTVTDHVTGQDADRVRDQDAERVASREGTH
jgi:hypothetical protein